MRIQSVKAWLQDLPLTKPYTIAYKTFEKTQIVFFELELENGIKGLGSANPFEDVVGETPTQTLHHLQQPEIAQLIGRDIRHYKKLIHEFSLNFAQFPGTLAAIDLALHDAFSKFLGIPLVDLFGRKFDALPTSITIGIKETREMLREAAEYKKNGFRILKIKTGISVEEDIERVLKLHEQVGNDMLLRVDANQGYSPDDLRRFLDETRSVPLELIEQPVPSDQTAALLSFTAEERKKFVADEALKDSSSALLLSHHPHAYEVFNIKLMKCGGMLRARDIATIAEIAGIGLFWGCNDESMASITAALHLAYSCANTRYLDLDGSFDLSRDWVTGGFTIRDGLMYCSTEPGLGLHNTD